MLIAWVPLVITLVSLLVYVLASNGKVVELARILFFVGAFFTVWGVADETLRVGDHAAHAR